MQCYQSVCDRHAGLSAARRSAVQSHQGAILTAITMLAYKKLSVFIKSKQIELHHSRQRVG
ncbi:MAG: hypothetical protein ACLSGI_10990 [Butyricicoccaceae bacterium]